MKGKAMKPKTHSVTVKNTGAVRAPWKAVPRLLTRGTLVVALGLMTVLGSPGTAQAAVPDHGTFASTDSFVDTETCAPEGFAINVTQTETRDFRIYFNRDGSFNKVIAHITYVATISANGHTINESDTWQAFFYPDGATYAGNTVHITGPGGIVQLDAGRIKFNPDGTVASISGPHPQLLGQTFCSALLP